MKFMINRDNGNARAVESEVQAICGRYYGRELATLTNEEIKACSKICTAARDAGLAVKNAMKGMTTRVNSEFVRRKL